MVTIVTNHHIGQGSHTQDLLLLSQFFHLLAQKLTQLAWVKHLNQNAELQTALNHHLTIITSWKTNIDPANSHLEINIYQAAVV